MAWLSSWLKEVIMVVLLASFVDLILPSRSMERYVKLVLSLLILLTLLGPLIKILTDAADIKIAAVFNGMNQSHEAGGKGSLQQIMDEAKQLQTRQQKQSLEWAAREVAAKMKDQIRKESGEQGADVAVVLAMPEGTEQDANQSPYIKNVTVTIKAGPASEETAAAPPAVRRNPNRSGAPRADRNRRPAKGKSKRHGIGTGSGDGQRGERRRERGSHQTNHRKRMGNRPGNHRRPKRNSRKREAIKRGDQRGEMVQETGAVDRRRRAGQRQQDQHLPLADHRRPDRCGDRPLQFLRQRQKAG